jgi:hypothetical protein
LHPLVQGAQGERLASPVSNALQAVIHLGTASTIDLTVPPLLLVASDEVIQ